MRTIHPTQEDIQELIKDDLTNQRIVHGLNAMGFNGDDYSLNLYRIIFKFMGIATDENRLDEIFSHYNVLSRRVQEIDVIASRDNLDPLVQEIYRYLLAQTQQ